jgi:hypothetical protein
MKIEVDGKEKDIPIWLFIPVAIIAGYSFLKEANVEVVYDPPTECRLIEELGRGVIGGDYEKKKDKRKRYERETYDIGGNTLYIQKNDIVENFKAYEC